MTPIASGRLAATHDEWAASPIAAALTDDEWSQLARVIIEQGEVLMADVPPRVAAAYLSSSIMMEAA